MEEIIRHSIEKASDEAVKLWALSCSEYPFQNKMIQEHINIVIIDILSSFALNARRAMEILPSKVEEYPLTAKRWKWEPIGAEEIPYFRWALDRIIHAKKLNVGFEYLPDNPSGLDGGALIVPYIEAGTDRKKSAFIDLYALSYTFLYDVLPALIDKKSDSILNNFEKTLKINSD